MEEKKNWKERLGGYDSMEEAMFVTIDEKTVYAIDELKEFIQQELDRAREEGEIEVLKDMQKVWDNDNLGDAPKYGSAGAGLMKRWIRDDINERLSKLTTK